VIIKAIRGIEDVEESVVSSQVVPTQLSPSPVEGSIAFAAVPGGILVHGRYSGDVRVSGPLSETDVTLGILIGGGQAQINGITLTPGGIGVFPAGFNHEACYSGGLNYLLFTVDRARIADAAGREGLRLNKAALDLPMICNLPRIRSERLRAGAQLATEVLRTNPDIANHPNAGKALSEEFLGQFLRGARNTVLCKTEDRADAQNGARLVRRAEDLLRSSRRRHVSVDTLCQTLGYSRRGLYRAFQSELGMSPISYLKVFRLSRVRQQLANAEPGEETSVTGMAKEWGFWDPGRFAGEYRTLFGELPSATLRKQRHA
jgi:AraC-like DNA-binding protein